MSPGNTSAKTAASSENEARKYFYSMHKTFIDIKEKNKDNINMEILSMGMSGDYAVAAEEGATFVRVGTALFGARNYTV